MQNSSKLVERMEPGKLYEIPGTGALYFLRQSGRCPRCRYIQPIEPSQVSYGKVVGLGKVFSIQKWEMSPHSYRGIRSSIICTGKGMHPIKFDKSPMDTLAPLRYFGRLES